MGSTHGNVGLVGFLCVTVAFAFHRYGMRLSALGSSFKKRPPSPFREADDPTKIVCSLGLLFCEPFLKTTLSQTKNRTDFMRKVVLVRGVVLWRTTTIVNDAQNC